MTSQTLHSSIMDVYNTEKHSDGIRRSILKTLREALSSLNIKGRLNGPLEIIGVAISTLGAAHTTYIVSQAIHHSIFCTCHHGVIALDSSQSGKFKVVNPLLYVREKVEERVEEIVHVITDGQERLHKIMSQEISNPTILELCEISHTIPEPCKTKPFEKTKDTVSAVDDELPVIRSNIERAYLRDIAMINALDDTRADYIHIEQLIEDSVFGDRQSEIMLVKLEQSLRVKYHSQEEDDKTGFKAKTDPLKMVDFQSYVNEMVIIADTIVHMHRRNSYDFQPRASTEMWTPPASSYRQFGGVHPVLGNAISHRNSIGGISQKRDSIDKVPTLPLSPTCSTSETTRSSPVDKAISDLAEESTDAGVEKEKLSALFGSSTTKIKSKDPSKSSPTLPSHSKSIPLQLSDQVHPTGLNALQGSKGSSSSQLQEDLTLNTKQIVHRSMISRDSDSKVVGTGDERQKLSENLIEAKGNTTPYKQERSLNDLHPADLALETEYATPKDFRSSHAAFVPEPTSLHGSPTPSAHSGPYEQGGTFSGCFPNAASKSRGPKFHPIRLNKHTQPNTNGFMDTSLKTEADESTSGYTTESSTSATTTPTTPTTTTMSQDTRDFLTPMADRSKLSGFKSAEEGTQDQPESSGSEKSAQSVKAPARSSLHPMLKSSRSSKF